MANTQDKCPVDHTSFTSPASSSGCVGDSCPIDRGARKPASPVPADKCPVDPSARASTGWGTLFGSRNVLPNTTLPTSRLPTDRETSSIPRADGNKWVYPSQAQFFSAMERKNHNPHAPDMRVIVPIHNAVNERAWAEVMKWEGGQGGSACGGPKLVSFKGRPGDRTPRARWKMLLGCVSCILVYRFMLMMLVRRYSPPFDRHDWVVDRCGTQIRYVIDFYTGHSGGSSSNNVSFYLDVRPALDSWEGVRLRAVKFAERWTAGFWSSSPSPPSDPAKTHS